MRTVPNNLDQNGPRRPGWLPRRGQTGRRPPAGRHRSARAPWMSPGRVIAIGLLAAIASSLIAYQYQFRSFEAEVGAHLYGLIMPALAASSAPVIWFGLGTSHAFGLLITPDCSSSLLLAPLSVLGIALMIPRRLPVRRVAKALAVAAAVMVTGNMLRIGVIALAIRIDGISTGYRIGHLVVGSVITIVCIVLGLGLLARIITRHVGPPSVAAGQQ
jgi:exosortase/archaeosortase family protein